MPPPIKLISPLPATDLLFQSMTATEGLSQLGEMQLVLISEQPDLMPEDLLGRPMTVDVELRDTVKRHFNGLVTRFGIGSTLGRHYSYRASVRPWLWFLTRTTDCRIFQSMTVPDIVKAIFADHAAIAKFEFKLFRQYRNRVYCVQYRESDFNFIARLLEDEGIYWYFEHSENEHKLVLVDDMGAHNAITGHDTLPYYGNRGQVPPDIEYIAHWSFSREVKPGSVVLRSYDFERPSTSLTADNAIARQYALSEYEQFDYQGEFITSDDGLQLAENRIDEQHSHFEKLKGSSNATGLTVGHLFTMERHPRADQNREYLCIQTSINAHLGTHEAGGAGAEFNCSFSAMPSVQQFRPLRRTPKPVMQGPQTAVVVGPAGEEIYTDKYGRVKVQFHWDRKGQRNDTSSCWLRVSSPWAGKSFGFIQIPRIGQEVVVDFLEGDPDQPLVTGRVYNAEQMPPWDLPANATQSGVLTRSSKGGGYLNANGLRFEDKKGSEQVWFHAEKDMSISVENDESRTVGHDETSLIQHHQKINVKKGREVYVEDDGETYYVKGLRKIFVKGHQEQVVTDGSDTFVTNKRGEYTTGDHIVLTTGKHVFKSTEAYINAGPLHFTTATDVKTLATASVALQAGTEFSAKAASFKFSATGNFEFTGNQFNRTIFEGNDTVLGANTNTYIGVSRDVAMGPAIEVYSGVHNSTAAGLAADSFLGMQISNFIGLSVSNALALSIANSGINFGIAGIDFGLAGIGLDNNGFKMYNGGAGAGGGGASLSSGATQIAALFAGIGLLGGAVDGIAAAVNAQSQANADIDKLLNDPTLTPEVRKRLRNAMNSRFTSNPTSDAYSNTISPAEIAAQTASLANGTPGAAPANDPTAGLSAPAAPGDPTAAPTAN